MTIRSFASARGASSLVAMIFLLILGFMALYTFRLSNQQLQLVGNAQGRAQVMSAANFAIEQTISDDLFVRDPDLVAKTPVPVDLTGDAKAEFTATMSRPACYRVRTVKTGELDFRVARDRGCFGSSGAGGAVLIEGGGPGSGDSQCADTEWNLQAAVTDTVTGAAVTVNQGVAVRVDVVDSVKSCT